MEHVEVDLETLSNIPGGVILSIGAVFFDPDTGDLGPQYYAVINTESCKRHGLHVKKSTCDWWASQTPEACQVLVDAASPQSLSLEWVLDEFGKWLNTFDDIKKVKMWSNGGDFDLAFLSAAYHAIGREVPWNFWNNRCHRTLKNTAREFYALEMPPQDGTAHNALDDAIWQAKCAMIMLKHQKDIQSLWETVTMCKAEPDRVLLNTRHNIEVYYDTLNPTDIDVMVIKKALGIQHVAAPDGKVVTYTAEGGTVIHNNAPASQPTEWVGGVRPEGALPDTAAEHAAMEARSKEHNPRPHEMTPEAYEKEYQKPWPFVKKAAYDPNDPGNWRDGNPPPDKPENENPQAELCCPRCRKGFDVCICNEAGAY
jgi:hypothetical protein